MPDETPKVNDGHAPLPVEETPIIDPASGEVDQQPQAVATAENKEQEEVIPEAARVFQSPSSGMMEVAPGIPVSVPTAPTKSKGNKMGTVLFIILLFGLGVWLSSQLRSFFAPTVSNELVVPTKTPSENTVPARSPESSPSGSASAWQVHEVMSGVTKKPIAGVTYKLPGTVKAPVCDSQSCASQGTNLPGGTRFTVAARGKGQLLPDFRGAILTDAAGREFTMKQGVFGGTYAYEYTGNFTGRTGGGYAFTSIRGVLMPVSETFGVEFNHFAPAGIATDFAKDDALFDEIIKSFTATGISATTPTKGSAFGTPSSTPIATASGN